MLYDCVRAGVSPVLFYTADSKKLSNQEPAAFLGVTVGAAI